MTVKVLYIASSPRSGSTILERVLGQIPGFVATGELHYLWERGLIKGQLCGCGQPAPQCDFWRQCLAEWRRLLSEPCSAEYMDDLLKRIMRLRYTYQQRLPVALRSGSYPSHELQTFSTLMAALFQAIATTSGAELIIDSSKLVSYGNLLLHVPGIEMHVLHLMRDSRAVVFSHQRVRERLEIAGQTVYMDQIPWWKVSLFWTLNNLSVRFLQGGNLKSITQVRYETFVEEPIAVMAQILEHIGYSGEAWRQIFVDERTVDLRINHTVAGNPSRFRVGEIELRQDDEWQTQMERSIRSRVTLLTLPLLLRYRYVPSTSREE